MESDLICLFIHNFCRGMFWFLLPNRLLILFIFLWCQSIAQTLRCLFLVERSQSMQQLIMSINEHDKACTHSPAIEKFNRYEINKSKLLCICKTRLMNYRPKSWRNFYMPNSILMSMQQVMFDKKNRFFFGYAKS